MADKKNRKVSSLIVGIIVTIFMLIGVVNVFGTIIDRVSESQTDNAKMKEYEEFIAPLIMNDPDTFDDVSVANQKQILSIAIWSILEDDLNPDQYEYADEGMLLPKEDVEEKFVELFGNQIKLVHATVTGGEGIEFKYSDKQGVYIIPITGITPIYTPKVIAMDETASSVVLSVAYLASQDWQQDENGNMVAPEPNKYVKITLGKLGDTVFVRAIQTLDDLEVPTKAPDKTETEATENS